MQFKTLLFSLVATALFGSAWAQDKIHKRDGEVIEAKIKSVGTKTVTYLRFDNQTGPEYTIVKAEVSKIVYQNGSEDSFDGVRTPRSSRHRKADDGSAAEPKSAYKTNVLAISPMQFSENGLGLGLSYERAIDKKGVIAFYLPTALTLNLNSTYYDAASGSTVNGHQDAMFYAMPGIKVYPTGSFGIVRYAVGPSLVIADGQKSSTYYDPSSGNPSSYQTQSHFMLGIVVNNSLNINPSPHVYLGLELGLGFSYMNRVGGLNQNTAFIAQGGFRIGYRF